MTDQSSATRRRSAEISHGSAGESAKQPKIILGTSETREPLCSLPGDGLLLGTFCHLGHHHQVPPLPPGSVWKTNLGHLPGAGGESRAKKLLEAGGSLKFIHGRSLRGRRLTHFERNTETVTVSVTAALNTQSEGRWPCGSQTQTEGGCLY